MINSLYQINAALVDLNQQLSNKQSNNQSIKKCIINLLSQVKYLQDKQKANYYFLISQIYASRFQNIQDAIQQLKQFDDTLDMQILMNCQFRIAFYKYFQQNYKNALKHLDTGLGYVQQQLKLTDNAKFFFSRTINIQNLISQVKKKNNFQAVFILSLIYQNQNKYNQSLKQIQYFISQQNDSFQKYQIYKRLLELYEQMRSNSLSTVSLSKKALQNYRQDLEYLQNKYNQFKQNYDAKYNFIIKVIDFLKPEKNKNKQKIAKKLLQYKLLAYYKLKKCSKLAPTKQIKLTLQNTAKLIKNSTDNQPFQSILNYDFVKQDYVKFQVLYKYTGKERLLKWKFIDLLSKYQSQIWEQNDVSEEPLFKKNKYSVNESNFNNKKDPILDTFKPKSILKSPSQSIMKSPSQSAMKSSTSKPFIMKPTQSQNYDQNFQGSKMIKIHSSSEGNQQRYFYINLQKVKDKPRLYYCNSKKQKGSNDNYYSLKGLQTVSIGKHTPSLKRKDTQKFSPQQCFALIFEGNKDRSFYVPDPDDFHQWIMLLQTKVLYGVPNISKMTNTMAFSKLQKPNKEQNKQSPQTMKTSRKIIKI